jgi:hypothetical protein
VAAADRCIDEADPVGGGQLAEPTRLPPEAAAVVDENRAAAHVCEQAMTAEVDGELFILSTGADDHSRYFDVEDLARLERFVART